MLQTLKLKAHIGFGLQKLLFAYSKEAVYIFQ